MSRQQKQPQQQQQQYYEAPPSAKEVHPLPIPQYYLTNSGSTVYLTNPSPFYPAPSAPSSGSSDSPALTPHGCYVSPLGSPLTLEAYYASNGPVKDAGDGRYASNKRYRNEKFDDFENNEDDGNDGDREDDETNEGPKKKRKFEPTSLISVRGKMTAVPTSEIGPKLDFPNIKALTECNQQRVREFDVDFLSIDKMPFVVQKGLIDMADRIVLTYYWGWDTESQISISPLAQIMHQKQWVIDVKFNPSGNTCQKEYMESLGAKTLCFCESCRPDSTASVNAQLERDSTKDGRRRRTKDQRRFGRNVDENRERLPSRLSRRLSKLGGDDASTAFDSRLFPTIDHPHGERTRVAFRNSRGVRTAARFRRSAAIPRGRSLRRERRGFRGMAQVVGAFEESHGFGKPHVRREQQ